MAAVTVPTWRSPRALIVGVLACLTLLAGLSIAPLRASAATPIYACVQNNDGQVFLRRTCLSTETRFDLNDRDRPVRLTVMTADGKIFYRRAPRTGNRITVDSPGAATLRFCYQQGANQRLSYVGTACPAGWRSITVAPRNRVPNAVNDAGTGYATSENTAFTTANVLTNDTDPDTNTVLAVSRADVTSLRGALNLESDGAATYDPSGHFSSLSAGATATETFTYTVSDGHGGTATATVTITVQGTNGTPDAVDDAPALADIEATTLAFTEGDAPTTITAALTVRDVDSTTLTGATVVITAATFVAGQDVLAFTDQLGITGSYNPATGVLTLDGDASPADYQTVLRSVTYGNASQNPSPANRTVAFQVDDGAAINSLSNNATRTVLVAPVNDASVTTRPGAVQTVNEDTNLVFGTANGNAISIADVDAGTAVVKLSLDVVNGTLTFPATTGLTFIDGTGNGQALVYVTGSVASINTALNGLTYRGAANYNSTRGAESLAIETNDQGNTGSGGPLATIDAVTISAAPVNDVPIAQAQNYGTGSIQTNMKRSLAADSGLLQGASDPDTGDGGYTASLTVGTVDGAGPSGATITKVVANVGTVTVTVATGAFDFDPAPGVTGTVSFTYTVCDSGTPAPNLCSTAVTASFTIVGPVIWFVNPAAGAGGDGRLSSPFNTLAGAAAVDAADHRIFIYSGAMTGSIALNAGEWLIGQGVTGAASFDALMGITPPGGTLGRPAVATGSVTTSGTITLATNTRVRAIAITTTGSTGMTGTGGLTGVDVAQVSISIGSGTALSLNNVGGTLDFTNVSKNGRGSGIELTNVGASVSIVAGSIQNTSIVGVSVVGGNGAFSYPGTVRNSLGRLIQVNNRTGGSVTFSGNLTGVGTGILVQNNVSGAPTITFSGTTKTVNTGGNPAVTLNTNTGASVNFTGGGLAITTAGGAGLSATGGGTVVVTTGTNPNTITSGSGTALNVTNTTIGSSGLTFRSISANGAANGIVLNNTGTAAGLAVTGNGGTCAVASGCSGGVIQTTTGPA